MAASYAFITAGNRDIPAMALHVYCPDKKGTTFLLGAGSELQRDFFLFYNSIHRTILDNRLLSCTDYFDILPDCHYHIHEFYKIIV